jgi:hypothetical protein
MICPAPSRFWNVNFHQIDQHEMFYGASGYNFSFNCMVGPSPSVFFTSPDMGRNLINVVPAQLKFLKWLLRLQELLVPVSGSPHNRLLETMGILQLTPKLLISTLKLMPGPLVCAWSVVGRSNTLFELEKDCKRTDEEYNKLQEELEQLQTILHQLWKLYHFVFSKKTNDDAAGDELELYLCDHQMHSAKSAKH